MKQSAAQKSFFKALQAHLAEAEVEMRTPANPPWAAWVRPFRLSPKTAGQLVRDLEQLWELPFADMPTMAELLIFRHAQLAELRASAIWSAGRQKLSNLFELLLDMALQGNSLFPQNPTDVARQVRIAMEGRRKSTMLIDPLIDLLLTDDGQPRTGFNFAKPTDRVEIVKYEHQRRSGAPEWCWKSAQKYMLMEVELQKTEEFWRDWEMLEKRFDLQQYRDSQRMIRRSPLVEGNWRKPSRSDLADEKAAFQIAFDFFCWKWFLYGMQGDRPMLQKLAVTVTPFGTQIFIPGFWSLDPARDINWAKVTRLHRARGIGKQGEKLANNREAQRNLIARIAWSDKIARQNGMKGSDRYDYIKRKAGLSLDTDNAEIRQYLRKGKRLK